MTNDNVCEKRRLWRAGVAALLLLLSCPPMLLAQQPAERRAQAPSRTGEPARPERPAPARQGVHPDGPQWVAPTARPARPAGVHAPQRPRAVAPPVRQWRLDQRYRHNHYYPPRGHVVRTLPVGSIGVTFAGANLFFHGGVWFRPGPSQYIVIAPPLGVVVPVLPPAFVTLWIGGAPYYYANGVYYAASPGQGYVVVAPPDGADAAQPAGVVAPSVVPPEPVIYPRQGQTPEQTEADRQACNRWATTLQSALADASVFQRAVAACMEGRGYTVR